MKPFIRALVAAAAFAALAKGASATVLTFDSLGDGAVPTNYGGLDWSAGGWSVFSGAQDPYTAHSGTVRAMTNWGASDADTRIGFNTATTFQGAWFAGLEGATVTFQLYYAGQLVATSATLDPSASPTFLSSGYTGLVDAVRITSPGQTSFVMDDLTFAQAVPEPEQYALLLAGLGVVGFLARRRIGG